MAKASDNLFPKVLVAEGSTPASPATGGQALFIDSADHKLKRVNSSGTVSTVEGGGGLTDFAQAKRISGDIPFNSASLANVDTGLDLVMTAAAGNVIECDLAATVYVSGTVFMVFDFVTVVGGVPVNSITTESAAVTTVANSFPGWGYPAVSTSSASPTRFVGSKRYTLQAGDISSGTVTLRLRAINNGAATIRANDPMLYVKATNLGPQI